MCKDMKKRPKIEINSTLIHQIAEEFNKSLPTVYSAINYRTNSQLAISIRIRAKRKLLEEASKITVDITK